MPLQQAVTKFNNFLPKLKMIILTLFTLIQNRVACIYLGDWAFRKKINSILFNSYSLPSEEGYGTEWIKLNLWIKNFLSKLCSLFDYCWYYYELSCSVWVMIVFVVKPSSVANGQNPKIYTRNKKLGCAPKTYNSAISVRKKIMTLQNSSPFLSLLLVQKIKEKITFECYLFINWFLPCASEILFRS